MAEASYHPEDSQERTGAHVLAQQDTGLFDGFKALAVEYTFGTQKIAVISSAGTNVWSPGDLLFDERLGLE
jgi:hypothetical protein